jgi:glycosyltransferase involved in cell wall biosynthesis
MADVEVRASGSSDRARIRFVDKRSLRFEQTARANESSGHASGVSLTMKVLIVHNAYQQPGGEDVVFEQERRMLEREGHQVLIYHRTNDEIKQYSALRQLSLIPRTVWDSNSRREFSSLLAKERPDLVHVHNTFVMISPSIFSACADVGIPVVHTLHNYRLLCPGATFYRDGRVCEECVAHTLWRSIGHGCYRDSRAVTATVALMVSVHRGLKTWRAQSHYYIALSEFARRKFVEGGLPSEKIFVKPNFVYPDPGASAAKENYAVFVGRLSPEKRVGTLLAAWQRLGSQFQLVIIGGGPERIALEAFAQRRQLSGVRFMGHLDRQDVIGVVRKARFLVFCSEWYENFPVTIAEAFACGTPVVGSRLGAMQEIVRDGITGLHFKAGDPNDLADKMEWAWTHPQEMAAMGMEARSVYESNYTADRNYSLLVDIYNRVLAANLS